MLKSLLTHEKLRTINYFIRCFFEIILIGLSFFRNNEWFLRYKTIGLFKSKKISNFLFFEKPKSICFKCNSIMMHKINISFISANFGSELINDFIISCKMFFRIIIYITWKLILRKIYMLQNIVNFLITFRIPCLTWTFMYFYCKHFLFKIYIF